MIFRKKTRTLGINFHKHYKSTIFAMPCLIGSHSDKVTDDKHKKLDDLVTNAILDNVMVAANSTPTENMRCELSCLIVEALVY